MHVYDFVADGLILTHVDLICDLEYSKDIVMAL